MFSVMFLTVMLQVYTFNGSSTFSSFIDGRQWDFVVTPQDMEGSPRWLATDDNPPVPPGAAVRAARLLLPQLIPSLQPDEWRLGAVTLEQVRRPDVWVYLVFLRPPDSSCPPPAGCGGSGPPKQQMRMVVLMNGQAVVPVSKKLAPVQ